MSSITGYWIPNVDAVELPGTRRMHFENTNAENATVQVKIPESQIGAANFWGLRNGGAVHPLYSGFHIKSIDIEYAYPKEIRDNTGAKYNDDCVVATLNYGEWQLPNQGYDSVLENISSNYAVPLRGLFWSNPMTPVANFADPVWSAVSMYLRRGNLRITRSYTGRVVSPIYIQAYHNTINSVPINLLEWGMIVPPEMGLFTVGNFSRSHSRDYSNPDPAAMIDVYSYSYSIELIQGTWNSLIHPIFGTLLPLFDRLGTRVSFYQKAAWDLEALLE